ncbi:uncharacterized protein ASCRUDRAFT_74052 [Ascoidea rubescens DSM 1968]|uniref:Uncharacterized protein n=1 Tax=Ascoidea rubescens DSM 1968 TaxID=1344418 RepID=A0A1D2VS74_9ASCO|nr:hypothetical protein ASCRUDRAFT_74052 [Ascoidea rubescens DSM 1968]ODV64427.1 hypothetical protein ASCRUDRAFT_74052 [Ascoidea rubescens DSM 1968]
MKVPSNRMLEILISSYLQCLKQKYCLLLIVSGVSAFFFSQQLIAQVLISKQFW